MLPTVYVKETDGRESRLRFRNKEAAELAVTLLNRGTNVETAYLEHPLWTAAINTLESRQ
jgi:hypothetical protein